MSTGRTHESERSEPSLSVPAPSERRQESFAPRVSRGPQAKPRTAERGGSRAAPPGRVPAETGGREVKKPTTLSAEIAVLLSIALVGCQPKPLADVAAPQAPGSAAAPAPVSVEETSKPAQSTPSPTEPAAPKTEPPVIVKGFETPESVAYDADADVYLVSNINGKPTEVDGNGFISKVSPEGKLLEPKWIDGSKKGSTLDAPKGLGLGKDLLYVADLTVVRMFDRKTGAPKGKVAVPGSTFLNDVAVGADGTVYVSDSGLKAGKEGFDPTGTDAIYKIGKNLKAEKIIASKDLGHPNGLLADDQGLLVVTSGTGALYRVTKDGKKQPDEKLPTGSLDGIVALSDGTILVSSWAGSAIYRGKPGGTFEPVLKDLKSPADIGFDTKRNIVLVPQFTENQVALAKLPK